MILAPNVLDLDSPETVNRITRFIKGYFENSGADGLVLGLSGGIDSSVIASALQPLDWRKPSTRPLTTGK